MPEATANARTKAVSFWGWERRTKARVYLTARSPRILGPDQVWVYLRGKAPYFRRSETQG